MIPGSWKLRLARRWLSDHLANSLDDNCSGASEFGFYGPPRGPDRVWIEFSAHTCPPNHRHRRPW